MIISLMVQEKNKFANCHLKYSRSTSRKSEVIYHNMYQRAFPGRNTCSDGDAPNSKHFVDVYISCNAIVRYRRIQNMFYEYGCRFHITVV